MKSTWRVYRRENFYLGEILDENFSSISLLYYRPVFFFFCYETQVREKINLGKWGNKCHFYCIFEWKSDAL